ncbi:hypothetical protein AC578_2521 [Pseudocercospora eumusae]|uniref:Uncharacterized protein n=1 Tax=Pseudocercospora eumusae TaxID=321146 RepID=A0A139GW08_9PEZI|nr:hypothetical protein AC578_2521 [Pseudocercospora eumusae]
MHAMRSLVLIAIAAISASAAPQPQSTSTPPPDSLSVSLNSDSTCSVLASGYPGSLDDGKCYTVPEAGIGSLTIYARPFEGGILNIWAGEDCEGEASQSLSTFYVGCQRNLGGGRSIKYIKPSE